MNSAGGPQFTLHLETFALAVHLGIALRDASGRVQHSTIRLPLYFGRHLRSAAGAVHFRSVLVDATPPAPGAIPNDSSDRLAPIYLLREHPVSNPGSPMPLKRLSIGPSPRDNSPLVGPSRPVCGVSQGSEPRTPHTRAALRGSPMSMDEVFPSIESVASHSTCSREPSSISDRTDLNTTVMDLVGDFPFSPISATWVRRF